jgi:SNF2 family DNA or RNA helicase
MHHIEALKDSIAFATEYEEPAVELVRKLPGIRWDPLRRVWEIRYPKSPEAINEFRLSVERIMLCAVWPKPEAVLAAIDAHAARVLERIESSRAASADVDAIPELAHDLRPFQRAAVAYARGKDGVLVADEMGLGKTVEALAILADKVLFPVVIVCPASLRLNWAREAAKWLPGRKSVVYGIDKGHKNKKINDIHIINYDILRKHADLLKDVAPLAVVFDESHYLKNAKSARSKAALDIASAQSVRMRLLLTGTPILNRPVELVHQLKILWKLEDLGGFWPFVKRYCNAQETEFGWNMRGASHVDELGTSLRASCMIRRLKSDVLTELPPKQVMDMPVALSNRREYKKAEEDFDAWLEERYAEEPEIRDITDSEERRYRLFAKVLKTFQGGQLAQLTKLREVCALGKLPAALEWIESALESESKIVVWAQHQSVQKAIVKRYPDALHIFGDDSPAARQRSVDLFQSDTSARLIVCSTQAGGTGWTLTAARVALFVELDWTPGTMLQAEDRIHRMGQADPVLVVRMLAENSIDGYMSRMLADKGEIISALTSMKAVTDTKAESKPLYGNKKDGTPRKQLPGPGRPRIDPEELRRHVVQMKRIWRAAHIEHARAKDRERKARSRRLKKEAAGPARPGE